MDSLNRLKELEVGKKYTVVGLGEFGFPYKFQIILQEVRVEPYAQYPESYLVIFKLPRKKNLRMLRFYENGGVKGDVIVWDGWVTPDTTMYRKWDVSDYGLGPVTTGESLRCFDPAYLIIARESIEQKPLIECFREIRIKEVEV